MLSLRMSCLYRISSSSCKKWRRHFSLRNGTRVRMKTPKDHNTLFMRKCRAWRPEWTYVPPLVSNMTLRLASRSQNLPFFPHDFHSFLDVSPFIIKMALKSFHNPSEGVIYILETEIIFDYWKEGIDA